MDLLCWKVSSDSEAEKRSAMQRVQDKQPSQREEHMPRLEWNESEQHSKAWRKGRVAVALVKKESMIWDDIARELGVWSIRYVTTVERNYNFILIKWRVTGCLLMLDGFWCSESKCVIFLKTNASIKQPLLMGDIQMSNLFQNESLMTK